MNDSHATEDAEPEWALAEIARLKELYLGVTTSVVRALLPPGLFADATPAPAEAPDTLDLMIQNDFVMLDREWTGKPSSEDGSPPWFPQEIVWHHCQLQVLLASGCITPVIAEADRELGRRERECAEAYGGDPFLTFDDLPRREALQHLDEQLDLAVANNYLVGVVETAFDLIVTIDPDQAFRLYNLHGGVS